MGIPIQISNYTYTYNKDTHAISSQDYSVFERVTNAESLKEMTPPIDDDTGRVDQSQRVQFKCIQLCVPVLNYALAGKGGTILADILGIKQKKWQTICACGVAYDIAAKVEKPIHETDSATGLYLGTDYIYKLIEDLDIDKSISTIILGAFLKALSLNKKKNLKSELSIVKTAVHTNDDYVLLGNYTLVCNDMALLKQNLPANWKEIWHKKLYNLLKNPLGRLALLLSIPEDKSSLFAMIAPFVIVLPYAMRMSTGMSERRVHPFTEMYQRIIEANASVQSYLTCEHTHVKSYIEYNNKLNRAVNALYYGKDLLHTPTRPNKDKKSIIEALSGKHGQIREYNLGKRQDYSGRSVVTISPYLSLDQINVPESMLPKLYEFHILPKLVEKLDEMRANNTLPFSKLTVADIHTKDPEKKKFMHKLMMQIIDEERMLELIPLYMGRQPTLHRHSFQGFHIGKSNSDAIQVNPLVCPAFNMDFDGDQAHLEVPISNQARVEVQNLILTTNNIYLAKDGSSTIAPRQDMLYGLFLCTRNSYQDHPDAQQFNISSYKAAYDLVIQNRAAVWDKVTVEGNTMTAGDAAFKYCFDPRDIKPRSQCPTKVDDKGNTVPDNPNGEYIEQISGDTIGKYITLILHPYGQRADAYPLGSGKEAPPGTFVGTINHLVELGFRVAKLYPLSIGLIDTISEVGDVTVEDPINKGIQRTMNYEHCFETFYARLEEPDFLYSIGLDTIDTYRETFNNEVAVLEAIIDKGTKRALSPDNGYLLMVESGARGKLSNLRQVFKYKGHIQKNSTESFDAIIENSYANQLTPLEIFINAYGGRQGQIDKSLKTGDTGYASRQMWHTTQGYTIVENDCGTMNGIEVSYEFLEQNFSQDDHPEELLANWLEGHYFAGKGTDSDHIITPEEAKRLAKDHKAVYRLRSPITCKNPCCQKCYGIDYSTHKLVAIGTSIGLIAAQSIGEPATQLTMNTFHKGGVSGASSVTSAFDRVKAYVTMKNLSKGYVGYDPVAWETGEVRKEPSKVPGLVNVKIGDSKKSITVSNKVELIQHARKGMGLSTSRGDYDLRELIEYTSVENAQRYLVAKLHTLYSEEVSIKFQHLEVLVAALTRYIIVSTDRVRDEFTATGIPISRKLIPGQCATAQEFYCGATNNTTAIKTLVGVKNIINSSLDAMDNIQMENVGKGISRISAINMTDAFMKPINRMLFAKGIKSGTNVTHFLEDNARRY